MSSVVAHLNDNFYRDFPRFPRPGNVSLLANEPRQWKSMLTHQGWFNLLIYATFTRTTNYRVCNLHIYFYPTPRRHISTTDPANARTRDPSAQNPRLLAPVMLANPFFFTLYLVLLRLQTSLYQPLRLHHLCSAHV